MRTSVWAIVPLLAALNLVQTNASAQEHRILVVSPRVGSVIDSVERRTYNLFPRMQSFCSASFYQAPDSTFLIVWTRMSGTTKLPDSTSALSYSGLCEYAEWIEHFEEIRNGKYLLGSTEPRILCEDGSPFKPPPLEKRVFVLRTQPDLDQLPLAPDSCGLLRPIFQTIHLDFMVGVASVDLSGLSSLGINPQEVVTPLTAYVDIPLSEEPYVSLLAGWSYFPQQEFNSFSMYILFRPGQLWFFDPVVGLGGTRTLYNIAGAISLTAEQSSVSLMLGINVKQNLLDALLLIPMSARMFTTFEGKQYSISITGPQFCLMLSL